MGWGSTAVGLFWCLAFSVWYLFLVQVTLTRPSSGAVLLLLFSHPYRWGFKSSLSACFHKEWGKFVGSKGIAVLIKGGRKPIYIISIERRIRNSNIMAQCVNHIDLLLRIAGERFSNLNKELLGLPLTLALCYGF